MTDRFLVDVYGDEAGKQLLLDPVSYFPSRNASSASSLPSFP